MLLQFEAIPDIPGTPGLTVLIETGVVVKTLVLFGSGISAIL